MPTRIPSARSTWPRSTAASWATPSSSPSIAPRMLTPLTGSLRAAFTETTIHFGGPTDRASYEKLLERSQHRPQAARPADDRGDRRGKPIRTEYPYAVQAFALGDQLTLRGPLGRGRGRLRDPPPAASSAARASRSGWPPTPMTSSATSPRSASSRKGVTREARRSYGSTFPAPLAEDIESIVVKAAHEMVGSVREKRPSAASR